MTILLTVVLIFGMGVLGVPVIFGVLSPLASAVVARTLPETSWDGAMQGFVMVGAALMTFLIGVFALGLPWVAGLIAAVMVGITSYARRIPDVPLVGQGLYSRDLYEDWSDHEYRELPKDEHCPHCRKSFDRRSQLDQHVAAKHPGGE